MARAVLVNRCWFGASGLVVNVRISNGVAVMVIVRKWWNKRDSLNRKDFYPEETLSESVSSALVYTIWIKSNRPATSKHVPSFKLKPVQQHRYASKNSSVLHFPQKATSRHLFSKVTLLKAEDHFFAETGLESAAALARLSVPTSE